MTSRSRDVIERDLAEARGDLSRLQARGEESSADARAALQRVVALQEELDRFGDDEEDEESSIHDG